ncbi:hypothetical protein CYMTET_22262 [Cymbomonas tetramitiformis]|uniref:Peroxin/Ferlin domain-containing protein n=1 Tax=Cymbomonas tetramitiformis TaxID=36881 RepID=A0AAE0G0I3_9CHLO|nr:hypothetical protein CYMTET_22262 [Cymbomonas tetramitiformis]
MGWFRYMLSRGAGCLSALQDFQGWTYGDWTIDTSASPEVDCEGWWYSSQFAKNVEFPPPAGSGKPSVSKMMRRRRWQRVRQRQLCTDPDLLQDATLPTALIPGAQPTDPAAAFSDEEIIQRINALNSEPVPKYPIGGSEDDS